MIQQMIYKGTAQGYQTVAVSAGLKNTALLRRLELLCRTPGAAWLRQEPCPIYSRCAVDGGVALCMTARDIHDNRNRSLSHVLFVPSEQLNDFFPHMAGPALFAGEFLDKVGSVLPEFEFERDFEHVSLDDFSEIVRELFGGDARMLAYFLALVHRCGLPPERRGFHGVCVRLPKLDACHSLAAYRMMELTLRVYRRPGMWNVGYRTLWDGPENNVQYPIFFTSPDYLSDVSGLLALKFVVLDVAQGEVRLPKKLLLEPDSADLELAEAMLAEDEERLMEAIRGARAWEKEQIAREHLEEQEKKKSEERARREAEAQARKEAEERARKEAEERARKEAEEQTRKEAEERVRREAEEQARKEAEERARQEAEERARQEAEERARKEAEERARIEAEAQARRMREEQERAAREEEERKAGEREKKEAEARAREEEARRRRSVEEREKKEAEARAREEERAKREAGEGLRRGASRALDIKWENIEKAVLHSQGYDVRGELRKRLNAIREIRGPFERLRAANILLDQAVETILDLSPRYYRFEEDYMELALTVADTVRDDLFRTARFEKDYFGPDAQEAYRLACDMMQSLVLLSARIGFPYPPNSNMAERLRACKLSAWESISAQTCTDLAEWRLLYCVFYGMASDSTYDPKEIMRCRRTLRTLKEDFGPEALAEVRSRLGEQALWHLYRCRARKSGHFRAAVTAAYFAFPRTRRGTVRFSDELEDFLQRHPKLKNDFLSSLRNSYLRDES